MQIEDQWIENAKRQDKEMSDSEVMFFAELRRRKAENFLAKLKRYCLEILKR